MSCFTNCSSCDLRAKAFIGQLLRMSSPPLCVICMCVWCVRPEWFPWQPATGHHSVWKIESAFWLIFITEVNGSIGLWFGFEGLCCIRDKQTDTVRHRHRDSVGEQCGWKTGPTTHCPLLPLHKHTERHTKTQPRWVPRSCRSLLGSVRAAALAVEL